jgi:hypothetical protein
VNVTPGLSSPSTVIAIVLNGLSGSVWVARTCSTSLVPIPNAIGSRRCAPTRRSSASACTRSATSSRASSTSSARSWGREVGPAHWSTRHTQAVEGLRARDLVDEVEIDVDEVGAAVLALDHQMVIPHLLGEGPRSYVFSPVRRPDLTIATEDHNTPTLLIDRPIADPISRTQIETLRSNAKFRFRTPSRRTRRVSTCGSRRTRR